MDESKEKKEIRFVVPLGIEQRIKVKSGQKITTWDWDIGYRFMTWLMSLLPRKITREVGSEHKTIRQGYFWIGENGQLERINPPGINEETEELTKAIGMYIMVEDNSDK